MARFLLVRHATHDYLTQGIAGRQPGIGLNSFGKTEAAVLAKRLSTLPIDAIFSGPLQRACETARPLADRLSLELQIAPEFDEVDVGDWTHCTFQELDRIPAWQQWNSFRSSTAPPNGELMLDVQRRAVGKILQLQQQQSYHFIAIFSHGDVIRAVLAHFLGLHLDLYARFKINPACASLIELGENSATVCAINVDSTCEAVFR
jgi:broad specificity phosphatase PhoE